MIGRQQHTLDFMSEADVAEEPLTFPPMAGEYLLLAALLPCCLAPCSLLLAPCSLLSAPCSLLLAFCSLLLLRGARSLRLVKLANR